MFTKKFAAKAFASTCIAAASAVYMYSQNFFEASFGVVEDHIEPLKLNWYHNKSLLRSFDHASIRRGFFVYDTVGKACHSLKDTKYRQMTEVAFTAEEVKKIAAQNDGYLTKPDDEGEVTTRKGVPNDAFWAPYANENEARAANNRALPPDLTYMVKARVGHEDYLFSLLTGYRDPPHGVEVSENMYYNPYFPGCQIGMPPPLAANAVDYPEGVNPSVCQYAKDVVTFLSWSASKDHDERHLMGVKTFACLFILQGFFYPLKKSLFNVVKKRKVSFIKPE
jgi:ubiquinol-cytochrome c reductase cytochrome c1 subunit